MEEGVRMVDGVEAPCGVDRHLAVRVPAEDEDGAVGRGRSEAEARVRQRAHLVS